MKLAVMALAMLLPVITRAQAPAPASLTAYSSTLASVLSWPDSPGAASYNVQRATNSGGPYALLANVGTTSYVDGAVTNGVEYYYVVAAVSNSVAGANSPESPTIPLASGAGFTFVNRLSGLALDSAGGAADQQAYSGTNQVWQIVPVGRSLAFYNASNHLVLTGTTPQAQLTLTSFNVSADQLWYLAVAPGGYYVALNAYTGQVLDDFGASTTSGTAVGQWSFHGGLNQYWTISQPLAQLTGVALTGQAFSSQYTFTGLLSPNKLDTMVICTLGTNRASSVSVTNYYPAWIAPTNFTVSLNYPLAQTATLHGLVTVQSLAGTSTSGDLPINVVVGPPLLQGAQGQNDATLPQATVQGLVYPNGLATTVVFEFGTNTDYGQSATSTLAGTNTYQAVNNLFGYPSLDRAVTLHARITATNAGGTISSGDLTFSSVLFQKTYSSDYYYDNRGLPTTTGAAAWVDLDNDGWLDLITSGHGQSIWMPTHGFINYNPGTNQTSWLSHYAPNGHRPAIAVADFDNDNRPDLFFAVGPYFDVYPDTAPQGTRWTAIFPPWTSTLIFGTDSKDLTEVSTNAVLGPGIFVENANVAVGDFDHTGRQDMLLSGTFWTTNNTYQNQNYDPPAMTILLQNNFTAPHKGAANAADLVSGFHMKAVNSSLPFPSMELGLGNSANQSLLAAGDFDGDGFPDIFALNLILDPTGYEYAGIYRGDGNFGFTPTNLFRMYPGFVNPIDESVYADDSAFNSIETASCALADFNGDGHLDMVLSYVDTTGNYTEGNYGFTTIGIWLNDGQGNLTNSNIVLPQLQYANVAAGDLFNHGRNDIVMVGYSDELHNIMETVVLRNDGGGVFTPFVLNNFGCIGENGHGLQLADYDKDGRLDIAMTGDTQCSQYYADSELLYEESYFPATHILRNVMNIPSNAPPAAPPGLATKVGNGTVTFHWGDATDDITPPLLLTYNLRVGTNSLGTQTVSPVADVTTGWRKIVAPGNCGHATNAFYRFPPGTYYWSVQAVDGGYQGGAWAPEHTFTITNPEPPATLSLGAPNNLPFIDPVPFDRDPTNLVAAYAQLAQNLNLPSNLLNTSTNLLGSGSNVLNLSWSLRQGGTLLQTTNLMHPNWTTNPTPVGTLNGQWSVLVTNTGGNLYFRLKQ